MDEFKVKFPAQHLQHALASWTINASHALKWKLKRVFVGDSK